MLNTMLATSTDVVLTDRSVTSDIPRVATSPGPFGTVLGIQLTAVFQSPVEGFALQVALPAKECRGAARNSSATAMVAINPFTQMFIGEHSGRRLFGVHTRAGVGIY